MSPQLLDVEAAWAKLSPADKKQIGMAAIAGTIGDIATLHLGKFARPGHFAARHVGFQALDRVLKRVGVLRDPKKAPVPDLSPWVRQCRECGCTDLCACATDRGGPCHWHSKDLCSCCVPRRKAA